MYQNAFDKFKRRFTSALILATFDSERQIVIETNVSDYTIGMYISQSDDEGRMKPIAFHSRKIISAELNYEIYNKELLVIVTVFSI